MISHIFTTISNDNSKIYDKHDKVHIHNETQISQQIISKFFFQKLRHFFSIEFTFINDKSK